MSEPTRPTKPWLMILAYAGPLGLLPLLAEKEDREVRWHARNGLAFFGALAIFGVAATAVSVFVPKLGCVYVVGMSAAVVLYVLCAVVGVVKSLQGLRLYVPGVSKYAGHT
ncbi:MAG: hypothetical protein ACRD00_05045 [Thermoanaerobaculia bacterium]